MATEIVLYAAPFILIVSTILLAFATRRAEDGKSFFVRHIAPYRATLITIAAIGMVANEFTRFLLLCWGVMILVGFVFRTFERDELQSPSPYGSNAKLMFPFVSARFIWNGLQHRK